MTTPIRLHEGSLSNGYVMHSRNGVAVLEHREVMARILCRPLARHEIVHHINHVRHDNRPENLKLVSARQHGWEHAKLFRSETHKECGACHQVKPRREFFTKKTGDPSSALCKLCQQARTKAWRRKKWAANRAAGLTAEGKVPARPTTIGPRTKHARWWG